MKTFVKTVPLVEVNNIIYPEIRFSKSNVLNIEYPVNIISKGGEGLSYKGNSGSFNYWFKKDRHQYKLYFTKKLIYLSHLNAQAKTVWTKLYEYGELLKFINDVNADRTLLFDN